MTKLYVKEELLSLYKCTIKDNVDRLVKTIKPAPLTCFYYVNLINKEQENDLKSLSKDESRRSLVNLVLEKDSLNDYINFSRCVHFINEVEAKRIFPFISDLFEVGLHDPLKTQADLGELS